MFDHCHGRVAEPHGFLTCCIVLVVFADQVTGFVIHIAPWGVGQHVGGFDQTLAEAVVEIAGADGFGAFAGGDFIQAVGGIPGKGDDAIAGGVACGVVEIGFNDRADDLGEAVAGGGDGVEIRGGVVVDAGAYITHQQTFRFPLISYSKNKI